MLIKILKSDVEAKKLVSILVPKAIPLNVFSIFWDIYTTDYGGDKVVGLYTLPYELMPLKGNPNKSKSRVISSIYSENINILWGKLLLMMPKKGSDVSPKKASKLLRLKHLPWQLFGCDYYVVISRDHIKDLAIYNLQKQIEELAKYVIDSKLAGSGGDVVFNMFERTGRVVVNRKQLSQGVKPNAVYKKLTGFDKPMVVYGTTDLANVFELLQTLKAGYTFGLPVAFENHPTAHNWQYWLDGFFKSQPCIVRY